MINFILGFIIGSYIIIGAVNTVFYILSTSITSLGYVSIEDVVKHFLAWPLYRAW